MSTAVAFDKTSPHDLDSVQRQETQIHVLFFFLFTFHLTDTEEAAEHPVGEEQVVARSPALPTEQDEDDASVSEVTLSGPASLFFFFFIPPETSTPQSSDRGDVNIWP